MNWTMLEASERVTLLVLSYLILEWLRYQLLGKSAKLSEPLIACLRSFPKDHFFQRFCEWAALYGDIVYAPLPGMQIVVLNSYEAAQELLSARPNSTAGRRIGYMVHILMGWVWSMAFMQPGHTHSLQRKMLRRSIGSQRVGSYNSLIEIEVTEFMAVLADFEGNPVRTTQVMIGHLMTKATYGQRIWREMGDSLTRWNMGAMDLVNDALFSFWLVDIIPLLRFVPSWLPGTRFKQIGRESTGFTEQIRFKAFKRAKELHNAGTLGHCIAHDLIEEFGPNGDVRDAMATTAAVITFLHAMFLFPDISNRVFEEIRSVTSGERLPQVTDRSSLPYAEAVWKEAILWRPFIPIGVPHVNDRDEVINGYLISKGTVIHQNNGLMLTDSRVWGDPETFRPERFLEVEKGVMHKPNPLVLIFGYGSRICPGMYIADKAAFHLAITTLALFSVVPLKGYQIPDPSTIEYTDTGFR
ncbi:cytochrome P450 [Serendipita vermifera]|nr:cytochrome P450 [Serendipita vermifera]